MNVSRIGPLALEERLGIGNTGSVYRAVHVELRRIVAVKVFEAPFIGKSDSARNDLFEEFELLKRLRHRNIVQCYGGIVDQSCGCLVYDLLEAESLGLVLTRRGKLAWELVVEYALQICAALQEAHELGVPHLALSPDKILIDEGGTLLITDFRVDRQNNLTSQGTRERSLERLAFTAPEQLAEQPTGNAKSDLYALGCLMFRMLAGRPPFVAKWAEELVTQQLTSTPPRLATLEMDCPVWLDALVSQLLEKEPKRRPHSAAAVFMALEETKRRMADRTGVVAHAMSGFSPLKTNVDRTHVRELLGRAAADLDAADKENDTPFRERTWFQVVALLGIIVGGMAFALWPESEKMLFEKADALMATNDRTQWQEARSRYLEPLLQQFPHGEFTERARQHIDTIDMSNAETRARLHTKLGREPTTDGERLFIEASKYEQFGDRFTAFDKYNAITQLLADESADRPYVNLARRQIDTIKTTKALDRNKFLQEQLADADHLQRSGKQLEARNVWQTIVTLYGSIRELNDFVAQAQSRLAEKVSRETEAVVNAVP